MPAERPHGPETQRVRPTDDLSAAKGVLVGIVIGLGFWAAVVGLAYLVTVLA